ncbi:hypothetical protein AGDE_14317 [Angomonas deanei]|nr:hypothetical protein AGDE_14317 [Angomonas deanei]|eukprot:EPY21050.1 hypothetical protein AGDE_14317 [Angomonas deanei]
MYPPPGNVPLDIPFGVDFMESPSEMKRPLKLSEVANAQKKLNAIERHNRHAQQQSNFAAPPQTNLEKTRSRLSDGSFLETPNFENKKTMPYASSLKLANPTGSQSSGSENGFPEGTSPKAANAVRPKRGSTKRKVAPLVISTVEEDETGELKEHDTDLLWKNQPRSPVERKRQATTQKEDGTEENANELVQDLLEYPPTPPTPAITSMENVPEEELKRRHNAAGMTPVLTKNVEMKEITELKLSSSKSSNDDGETRAAQPAPKARMTSIALMLRCVTPPGEESTTDSPTISHTNSQTFTGNDDGNPSNGKTSLPKSWKISKRTPGKFDREEAARYRREVEMEELQIDKEVKELNSVPSFMERIARPFPPIPDTPSPSSSAGNSDMTDFKKVKLPRAGGTSSDDSISSS